MLKKIIYKIRFLAMSSEEFASSPVHSGILTEYECLGVFVHLNNPDSSRPIPIFLSSSRNQRQSSYSASESDLIETYCLRHVENETRALLAPSNNLKITLTADKDVVITGIVIADTALSTYMTKYYYNFIVFLKA